MCLGIIRHTFGLFILADRLLILITAVIIANYLFPFALTCMVDDDDVQLHNNEEMRHLEKFTFN